MEIEKATATHEVEKAFVGKLKRDFNVSSGTLNGVIQARDHPHSAQGGGVPCDSESGLWRWRSQIGPERLNKSKLLEWRSETAA